MINKQAADRFLGGKFDPKNLIEILEQIHAAHPNVGEAHMTFDYQELGDEQVEGEVIPYITFGLRSAVVNIKPAVDVGGVEEGK